jgi:hypothetical protein
MENPGLYIAMAVGALIIALVLAKWGKHRRLATAGIVLLALALIAVTVGPWKTIQLNMYDLKFRADRDLSIKQPSSGAGAGSRVNAPSIVNVSGRYYGMARAEWDGSQGQVSALGDVILDIRAGAGGSFSGTLSSAGDSGEPAASVEGQVSGRRVTFVAHVPGETGYISFEGAFSGNSMRGNYRVVGPNSVQALKFLRSQDVQEPLGEIVVYR